jgi:hypothetical protein
MAARCRRFSWDEHFGHIARGFCVTFSSHEQEVPIPPFDDPIHEQKTTTSSHVLVGREFPPISILAMDDPGVAIRTCANCGAEMDERKCKLICRCGYFLSCSDYY